MATLQEVEQALRAADAAGNTEDATALAAEYARLKGAQQKPQAKPKTDPKNLPQKGDRSLFQRGLDTFEAIGRGVPVLGSIIDEGAAAINATVSPYLPDFIPGSQTKGDTWSERYDNNLNLQRGAQKRFDEKNPVTSPALQLAGGVASVGGALKAAPKAASVIFGNGGTTLAGQMLRGGTSGLTLGALHGFGMGEGGAPERTSSAIDQGMLGGLLGAAAPVVINAASRPAQAVADYFAPRVAGVPDDVGMPTARRASRYVSGLVQGSGKSLDDLPLDPAIAMGKPVTSAQAIGKTGTTHLGSLARRTGETADALQGYADDVLEASPERMLDDFSAVAGIDPRAARGELDEFVKEGRVQAAPLYDEALAGGSIAPLEHQFRQELIAVTGKKGSIAREIAEIERTKAGALAARGAAGAKVRARYMELQNELKQIETERGVAQSLFQKAQADGTASAPGAVWNPRIQQFLDDPIFQRGIREGLEVQRLEALAAGKRFNPSEYAIVGADDAGNPVVGTVPNMRLLDAAKRGLDDILEGYRDKTSGKLVLDQRGRAVDAVRRSFLDQLDKVNPAYATARSAAGDYLSASDAFRRGQKTILNGNLPARDFETLYRRLGPKDAEAFKGGIANELFNKAQNGQLNPKRLKSPIVRQKLAVVLGKEQANALLARVEQEARILSDVRYMRPGNGSGTMGWKEAGDVIDGNSDRMESATDFLGDLMQGRPIRALARPIGKAAQGATDRWRTSRNVGVRNEAGRMLMLPPEELARYLNTPGLLPKLTPQRLPAGAIGFAGSQGLMEPSRLPRRNGGQ